MALTAWDGNTCRYLGVRPLKQQLTHKLEMVVDPNVYTGGKTADDDPFGENVALLDKPKPLTLTEDFRTVAPETEDGEVTYKNANVKALAQFYQRYLVRKDVATMTNEVSVYPEWPATCYFLGLSTGDQGNNPGVVQEIGWQSMYGGMGLYNPISKNPVTDVSKESGSSPATE